MSETPILYDLSEAVRQLNRVEEFEPKEYLRKEETEDGVSFYLDTKYRILWYRLMYPNGKVYKIPTFLDEKNATFEVRIYADINDSFENCLANGFASRYKDEVDAKLGLSFLESAETAALGRALKDAGFGTQFCDVTFLNDLAKEDTGEHILYDLSEAVKHLNHVVGFEPKNYLRKEEKTEGASYHLDAKYRILWYRLMYPRGKVFKIPKVLNKEYATFEVRVYKDINDPIDNFLANGFASRYKDESNEQFGLNFVETAETAALGRALKDAGFGTQFCDVALPNDSGKVDAGVQIALDPDADGAADAVSEGFPEGIETPMMKDSGAEDAAAAEEPTEKPKAVSEPKTESKPEPKAEQLTKDMPVDELVKKMSVEYAKTVVVDTGYDIGKTIGELAEKKPKSIEFHAARDSNNLVKAAATVLLRAAKSAA